jgi:hypothetical protein
MASHKTWTREERLAARLDLLEAGEIMANSAPGGASGNNTKIVEEFRANAGCVGGAVS